MCTFYYFKTIATHENQMPISITQNFKLNNFSSENTKVSMEIGETVGENSPGTHSGDHLLSRALSLKTFAFSCD